MFTIHDVQDENRFFNPLQMGAERDLSLDELRTHRLIIETCQNFFKAVGFDQLGNVFGYCRSAILWTYHGHGLVSGELRKTLEKNYGDLTDSPHDLSRYFNACRDSAELITIPLGIALKNGAFSETLAPILEGEYKNLLDKAFYIKIPEKNAYLQAIFQKKLHPGASSNEKLKFIAEKLNACIEVAGILSIKNQFHSLSLALALTSSLAKVYAFYLERTDTSPAELFKIIKMESVLTLKKHLVMISHITTEENEEIKEEMGAHLNLIETADNDGIYDNLLCYKNSMIQLFSIYHVNLENFDNEIDQLLKSCKPLIARRENLEQTGGKLLQDHGVFLKGQLEKLHHVFKELEKCHPTDFKLYIKPELEAAIKMLNEHKQQNEDHLKEFTIDPKFGISPFAVLSIDEQKKQFEAVVKTTSTETQQQIIAVVKYVCREV